MGLVGLATNPTFEVIRKANEIGAQFLLTHHGGWKKTDMQFADEKMKMLKKLGMTLSSGTALMNEREIAILEERQVRRPWSAQTRYTSRIIWLTSAFRLRLSSIAAF